ncbi:SUN domain-containing ossification factor, partial [Asbolus verrucosus]
ITTSGQPVVVTLADVATAELQQRAIIPSQNEKNQVINQTENSSSDDFKPEINQSRSEPNNSQQTDQIDILKVKENLTEEIPSFSEWAQKRLEEAEKNKEPSNASAQHQSVNGKQGSGAKLRWKNYASLDCGAKVVASNPEAVSPSAILSPSRDEYKLNTCTSRIWFIVELCEAIQAKKIDLANFELFSSSPKDFVVSVSDRFPTREWSNVGQFTAKDERDVQSFDLHPHLFGKYIKVEVKSHYGSEHYCPISLFRVYGTSEFEVLQKEDPVHADRLEDDDDDDDESLDVENGDSSKNLFSSATDAVISMVKKAAEVLGNKGNYSNQTEALSNTTAKFLPLIEVCTSPSHLVVCDNCSDTLFGEVYELLSCRHKQIRSLVEIAFIQNALLNSNICYKFGFDFSKRTDDTKNSQFNFVKSFFPERYIGAMCNTVAVLQNKVVFNISNGYINETQAATDDDKLVNIETSEPHITSIETIKDSEITDALILEATDTLAKSTCSTDVSYTSQIKPTKTLTSELDLKESNTEASSPSDNLKVVVTTTQTAQSNLSEKVLEVVNPEIDHHEKLTYVETVTDSVENLDDNLEHFINEFNGDSHHLPSAQTTATTTPQAQKESVFLRLSNRIKALERNMSLSGQYLEELSKRYKKQVEEIQKLLDKTILSINEESKKKDEYNKQLEERLTVLTAAVEALISEKKSWSSTVYCVIVSSLVTLFIVSFCCKTPDSRPTVPKSVEIKRRKSIDVVTHSMPQKKKRRPSDQALKIVRSSMETSEGQTKKKKKKKQMLKRSNSISTLSEEGDYLVSKASLSSIQVWNRQESAPASVPVDWVEGKHIEDVPFVLEESEHSSLEPLTLPDAGIAAPNFLRTALNARSVRVNGDAIKSAGVRKSASADETSRKSSPAPSINGNLSLGEGHETPKREKKGFKKIFKKVF